MTLRGIGRSKRRSFSTVLGVVLALILILASVGMIDSVIGMIDKQFNEVALQDASVISSEPVSADLISSIGSVVGVTRAEPTAGLSASITHNGDTLATALQGFESNTQMHGWTNPSGALPPTGVLAGQGIANKLGVSEGDLLHIDLPTHDVTIVLELIEFVDEPLGIPLYARLDVITEALRDAGIEDPESLMAEPTVTSVMTLFDPALNRSTTIAALEDVDGVLAVQDARSLYDMIQQFLGLFYAFVGVMLIFGGLMAFSLMFNTISVNIAERSTEFATLKANGMADRMIASMVVNENMLLTTIGIIPGVLLGIAVSALFLTSFNNDSFTFALSIEPGTIAVAIGVMYVVALLSMVPGLRSIKRLDIAQVVRERAA
jgi:putative ABC transport system permease protein